MGRRRVVGRASLPFFGRSRNTQSLFARIPDADGTRDRHLPFIDDASPSSRRRSIALLWGGTAFATMASEDSTCASTHTKLHLRAIADMISLQTRSFAQFPTPRRLRTVRSEVSLSMRCRVFAKFTRRALCSSTTAAASRPLAQADGTGRVGGLLSGSGRYE